MLDESLCIVIQRKNSGLGPPGIKFWSTTISCVALGNNRILFCLSFSIYKIGNNSTYTLCGSMSFKVLDAFELWWCRRLLRVPWTARRPNQPILKEIIYESSLEGLMLKLQYFGHLMWTADSLEKTLMLGKIEGRRRRGWQRMRWLDDVIDSMYMSLSKLGKIVEDRGAWCAACSPWGRKELDTT